MCSLKESRETRRRREREREQVKTSFSVNVREKISALTSITHRRGEKERKRNKMWPHTGAFEGAFHASFSVAERRKIYK